MKLVKVCFEKRVTILLAGLVDVLVPTHERQDSVAKKIFE